MKSATTGTSQQGTQNRRQDMHKSKSTLYGWLVTLDSRSKSSGSNSSSRFHFGACLMSCAVALCLCQRFQLSKGEVALPPHRPRTIPIKYFHAYVALIKTTRSQAERLLCSGILRRVGAQIIPFHFIVELYFAFQTLFKSPQYWKY